MRIIGFICMLLCTVTVMGQNALDDAINDFKAVGEAEFSSVVERDPQTHQILRVVKKLEIEGKAAAELVKLFKEEAAKADKTFEKEKIDHYIRSFTEIKGKQTRIYSIEYEGYDKFIREAELTIIIKNEKEE